eukprot:12915538-Prorocentrum_lima.AAC.1
MAGEGFEMRPRYCLTVAPLARGANPGRTSHQCSPQGAIPRRRCQVRRPTRKQRTVRSWKELIS